MAYTTNPNLPRLRASACEMVVQGKSVTEVARYYGYSKGTISKWMKKYPKGGAWIIPTTSSRPHTHPKQINSETRKRIKELRIKLKGRCAEVIQKHLAEEGVKLHRITVQRTLDKLGLTNKRSPWKRFHKPTKRPKAVKPGDLIQIDTIHLMKNANERIYIYTLIDVHSRWCYAWASDRINTRLSLLFLRRAQRQASFTFQSIQSDHGPEFSQHFTERLKITHRHSRVRQPNDNAHLERFNRTIQQEFLTELKIDSKVINRHMSKYLNYYNNQRYHLGINLKTPAQIINECFQAIV